MQSWACTNLPPLLTQMSSCLFCLIAHEFGGFPLWMGIGSQPCVSTGDCSLTSPEELLSLAWGTCLTCLDQFSLEACWGQGVETLSKYLRFFVSDSPCLFSALMPLMPGLQLCFLNSRKTVRLWVSPSSAWPGNSALVSGQL